MKKNEFDQILEELEKMGQNQERVLAVSQADVQKAAAEAAMAQEIADNLAKKFEEEERKNAEIKEKIEKARAAYEDVKKALAEEEDNADSRIEDSADVDSKDEEVKNVEAADTNSDEKSERVAVAATDADSSNTEESEEKKNNGEKAKRIVTTIGAIVGISALSIGAYILIKDAISGKVEDAKDKDLDKSMSDGVLEDNNAVDAPVAYDYETNTFSLEDALTSKFEPLTYENFEKLMGDYVILYKDAYQDVVSTEDLIKFGAIANIDLMVQDNKELASILFTRENPETKEFEYISKEEYLNDAAKIIGTTVMYNFIEWNNFASTENFIRVSDIIYGEQKEKMLKIEEYTDKIADAANKDDADLVNEIVSEFLTDMSSGSLSKLDDGVGFAAQVNIAVIADGIARNYLNQENFDMFQILKTSEKYVSNIFRVYEGCANEVSNTKTLTK